MSPYLICKRVYQTVLPKASRDWLFWTMPTPLLRVRRKLIAQLEKTAAHDEIYSAEYFRELVDPSWGTAADVVASSIVSELAPRTVIDIGCGSGMLLLALKQRGVEGIGFDCAQAALELCQSRGLSVSRLDIENDPIPAQRADLVISTEVAEHLPAQFADRFVEILATLAPQIVLTAATPSGLAGDEHVNEQPNEYWIEKIQAHSGAFRFDGELSMRWRQEWAGRGVADCYARSIMVFRQDRVLESAKRIAARHVTQ